MQESATAMISLPMIVTNTYHLLFNGSKFGDSLGYLTSHQYNGSAVVDCIICCETLFKQILNFKVHNFHGSLSDHCMISLTDIATKPQVKTAKGKLFDMTRTFKWGEGRRLQTFFQFDTHETSPRGSK